MAGFKTYMAGFADWWTALFGGTPTRFVADQGVFVRGLDMNRRTSAGVVTPHWGIDIGAPAGTPVHAVAGGTVVINRPIRGYGNAVGIAHDDGRTSSFYGHMQRSAVEEGARVTAQQIIGYVGTTTAGPDGVAPFQIGPHLHMEIHPTPEPQLGANRRLDPVVWLRNNSIQQFASRWRHAPGQNMGVA